MELTNIFNRLDSEQFHLLGHLSGKCHWMKRRLLLCAMTFFGWCMNCTYFVCITNYVGQVLYKGNPVADAGSEEYKNYIACRLHHWGC